MMNQSNIPREMLELGAEPIEINNSNIQSEQQDFDIPEELRELGATRAPIGEGQRYAGMAARASIPAVVGAPADILNLANTFSEALGGLGGIFGGSIMKKAAEVSKPLQSEEIRQKIDVQTGEQYKPQGTTEEIASKAIDFFSTGGILGGLKKGKIALEAAGALGAAIGSEALEGTGLIPEISGAVGGDILARLLVSGATRKAAVGGLLGLKSKGSKIDQEAVKAASELGLETPISAVSKDNTTKFIEKKLTELPFSKQSYDEAANTISKDMIDKLEVQNAVKFNNLPDALSELGAETQQETSNILSTAKTAQEQAFDELAKILPEQPIDAAKTKELTGTLIKDLSLDDEARKVLTDIEKSSFATTSELSNVLESIHPEEKTSLELGETIQENIKKAREDAKNTASKEYRKLDSMAKDVTVDTKHLSKIDNKILELEKLIGETRLPDEFTTILGKTKKLAKTFKSKGKEVVPLKDMLDLEKSINSVVDYTSDRSASRLLLPLKKTVQDIIQSTLQSGTKTGESQILQTYNQAKKLYGDYAKKFINQDAINSLYWSQKPEEVLSKLKSPSYFKQFESVLSKDSINQLKRALIERLAGKERLSTGKVLPTSSTKIEEYKSVFGKDLPRIKQALSNAATKQNTTPQNILSSIKKLDDLIDAAKGSRTKEKLTALKNTMINDLKATSPQAAKAIKGLTSVMQDSEKLLQSKALQSILKNDPSQVVKMINTVDDLKQAEKALARTPQGKKIFESIKRAKIQDILAKKMFNKEGNVSFAKLNTAITDLLRTQFGRDLIGKDNLALYENLQKYSRSLENAATSFANFSGTATTLTSNAIFAGIGHALVSMLSGNLVPLVTVFGTASALNQVAKYMTDPIVKKKMLEIAKANKQELAKKSITPQRAYKILKPAIDWSVKTQAEFDKNSEKK